MDLYATCAFGLEALVKEELTGLAMNDISAMDARVFFSTDAAGVARANINLRCADRVFIKVGSFKAESFEELYQGMSALPWPDLLPKDAAMTVTGKTAHSKLVSVRDMQAIGKKALVDSMVKRHKYPRCPESGLPYTIEIGMLRDEATIGINTSGAGLNRRGYRDLSSKAPLRETLAAAMVKLAQPRHGEVLYDPCCGSGTIAIEAAMIAANIAPGLGREFAFEAWPEYAGAAREEREQAESRKREEGFAHIEASDLDASMVSMTRRHARRAGVTGFINVKQADVREMNPDAAKGVIVVNPPYGDRLDIEQGRQIYAALGRIKAEQPGYGIFALSGDDEFSRYFGHKPDKRRKLYNGNKKVNLNMYFRARK